MNLSQVRALAASHKNSIAAIALATAAGIASATPAAVPTLDTVVTNMVTQIMTGVGTTFSAIMPLLTLVFGVAFAYRWVTKAAK